MSVNIKVDGKLTQLDRKAEPDESVVDDVRDVDRLSRLLLRIVKSVRALERRFAPQRIDFEDVVIDGTGTTLYRFVHNLGTRVRWWPVDWTGAIAGPRLVKASVSDANVLALVSYTDGTVTLRVEPAS